MKYSEYQFLSIDFAEGKPDMTGHPIIVLLDINNLNTKNINVCLRAKSFNPMNSRDAKLPRYCKIYLSDRYALVDISNIIELESSKFIGNSTYNVQKNQFCILAKATYDFHIGNNFKKYISIDLSTRLKEHSLL